MSRRAAITLAIFGVCLLVVLGGVAWISLTALDLVDREREARRQAVEEENVRLALWRMDSSIAPILARESARPYFTYAAYYPAERAYTRMFGEVAEGEVLVASPLLSPLPERVLLHFQIGPGGEVTSPEAPAGRHARIAREQGVDPALLEVGAARLAGLQAILTGRRTSFPSLAERLPFEGETQAAEIDAQLAENRKVAKTQRSKSSLEWLMRSRNIEQAANYRGSAQQQQLDEAPPARAAPSGATLAVGNVSEGPVTPVWIGDALVLARRIRVDGREYVQGCWLDWPSIRDALAGDIRDLLPNATLAPSARASGAPDERRLASLPVELVAGAIPLAAEETAATPVPLILGTAWAGVLLAAAAVVVLLLGAIALSERRADFVSAVTHELRTPLTTFRMYSEMLADDMIRDPAQRKSYLETLRREAVRLSHLVENVLAYARIERGRATGRIEVLSLRDVIGRFGDVLSDRAAQAGMSLAIELGPADARHWAAADATAVEQILFNLVDNACKYAASAEERSIRLSARADERRVRVAVRDRGPGLSAEARRRLFSPFSKSAARAATSAPGVGLGLALSRRLARTMGGDLALCDPPDGGAEFVLTLPAGPPPASSAHSENTPSSQSE